MSSCRPRRRLPAPARRAATAPLGCANGPSARWRSQRRTTRWRHRPTTSARRTNDARSTHSSNTFHLPRPHNLRAAPSCTTNRGAPDAPMFQFNHWVTPAESLTARRVNSELLRERLVRCASERGRGPIRPSVRPWSSRTRRSPTRRCRGIVSSLIPSAPWPRRTRRVRRHLRGRRPRAAHALPVLAGRGAQLLRAHGVRREQRRRRLDHAPAQAARRAVRRSAHAAPPAVRARRRALLSHRARCGHRRRVRRARRRGRHRRVRVHPPTRTPHGARGVGRRASVAAPRGSTTWSTRSTSSTVPPRSCTPRRWPRWRRRESTPSSRPWPGSRCSCARPFAHATRSQRTPAPTISSRA